MELGDWWRWKEVRGSEKGNPRFSRDVCISIQTEKGEGVEGRREKEEEREEGGEEGGEVGGGGRRRGLPARVFQIV
jgi:hypothetical protein